VRPTTSGDAVAVAVVVKVVRCLVHLGLRCTLGRRDVNNGWSMRFIFDSHLYLGWCAASFDAI